MTTDTQALKPRPRLTRLNRPFWEASNAGRLELQRCAEDHCARWVYFPRAGCPHCGSMNLTWQPASGHGVVVSYTVIRRVQHPGFAGETPYYFIAVKLEEGPLMYSRLVEPFDPALNPMNRAVRCVFVDQDNAQWLPYFTLAD